MLRDFLSLIFPEVCAFCKTPTVKGEELLCSRCLLDLPKTNDHLGRPPEISDKFSSFSNFKFAWSYLKFSKKGVVQRLLHQLKYNGEKEIAVQLGRWYGEELVAADLKEKMDLIVPVPLHLSRLRTRGYNQSDYFARGLSESIGIDYNTRLIRRIKKTATQTKMDRVGRWENVEKIFETVSPGLIKDKNIIVVDDVITTGATLNSCLRSLARAGANQLAVLTLARAT